MTRSVLSVSVPLLLAAAAVSWATPAHAKVTDQGGELYSIEKRDLMGSHEVSASLGTLPIDAFAKGLTLYGSYTYHFTHLWAWELAGGMWSFNFDTGLEQELKDRFDVQPTDLGELQWIFNSNLVIKPLYGKFAITNDRLFTAETFFTLGYALGGYTAALPSGVSMGMGIRLFLGKYFSMRFDIRDYLFLPELNDVDNNLYVSLGLSLTFGFGDEETGEE